MEQQNQFERVAKGLYRRGGKIYARVRVDRKHTWRSTETNDINQARQWKRQWRDQSWRLRNGVPLKGVLLERKRLTVGKLIDDYIEAGFPTRNMQAKLPCTIEHERRFLRILRAYFETV